jgi:hypothetical protein
MLKHDEGTGTHWLRIQGATPWMVQGKTPASVSVHHRSETGWTRPVTQTKSMREYRVNQCMETA